jgi:hypothetical protein
MDWPGWCSMPPWTFLDYITDEEVVPVDEWVNEWLTLPERAEFDVTVDYLSRIRDWDEVKKARRKYEELRDHPGLTELKFKTTSQERGQNRHKQFRPLGLLKRSSREFIFIGGFQKDQSGQIPDDAFAKAMRYKREYEDDKGRTRAHKT